MTRGGGELSKLFSSMRTCAVRCQNDCLKVFLFRGLRVCSRAFVCEGAGTLLPSLLRSKVSHGVVSRQSAVTQSEWVPVLWPRLLYPWICRAVSHKRCNALGMQKKQNKKTNLTRPLFGLVSCFLRLFAHITKCVNVPGEQVVTDRQHHYQPTPTATNLHTIWKYHWLAWPR